LRMYSESSAHMRARTLERGAQTRLSCRTNSESTVLFSTLTHQAQAQLQGG
jgi:hypothetical protein